MLLDEFFDFADLLENYGRHGFPGTGQRLFTEAYYQDMASFIGKINPVVRQDVLDWTCEVLAKDNSKFDEEIFRRWVEEGRSSHRNPRFQQRHFYYLAHFIADLPVHKRVFIASEFGKFFKEKNPRFQYKRWYRYCQVPEEYRTEVDVESDREDY